MDRAEAVPVRRVRVRAVAQQGFSHVERFCAEVPHRDRQNRSPIPVQRVQVACSGDSSHGLIPSPVNYEIVQ